MLENRRLLVVDDTPAIHEDFRKILQVAAGSTVDALQEDEELLFGAAAEKKASVAFQMESAHQGIEAIEKVAAARQSQLPYAMAFVDMRMPPGLDGVQTIEALWKEDPDLQVVLCTAYSDYSWNDVLNRLDVRDRLLLLKKPFDRIEVFQLANALTTKWVLSRQAAMKMDELEEAVRVRTQQLTDANIVVQNSPVILYRLRGDPTFPLIYISHNITKLGHDPQELIAASDWAQRLVHHDDLHKVGEARIRVLDRSASGASIEFRMRTADGNWRWMENRSVPIRNPEGQLTEVEGILIDITERKSADERVTRLARTDSLTDLANRSTFMDRLNHTFAAAKRGASPFAVLYLDLDEFKPVNDELGHAAGDALLQAVARRLLDCTRQTDLVARLGGDEFAILQFEIREPANAGQLATKINYALSRPFSLDGIEVNISVSIGIAAFDSTCADAQMLLAYADRALYRSKEEGRNRFHFHSEELDREVQERVRLAEELRVAIDGGQLELQYQPQIELGSSRIVGMEALVRWHHPRRGLLGPGVFLPIAERTGSIIALGRWVLEHACAQLRAWRDAGLGVPLVTLNLSLMQLQRGDDLLREVTNVLSKWNLSPADLEFDVTEATLAQLKWSHSDVLARLRRLGVAIAIDNFGAEYSSFEYVRAYGINHLKIAQSFINRSSENAASAATVNAIMSFAREVGVGVIAQGVETQAQKELLAQGGAGTWAQGFHFSEAVSADRAGQLLRIGRVSPVEDIALPQSAAEIRH